MLPRHWFLLALLLISTGCNELKQEHFDSLAEAKQKHMIEKGWIPAFVPDDAKDIDTEGDLDTSNVYGQFLSKDTSSIRGHCIKIEGLVPRPHQSPKWFPTSLAEASRVSELESKGYEIFKCGPENMVMAVVPSQSKVFYWAEPLRR